jgi:hypothetical protein
MLIGNVARKRVDKRMFAAIQLFPMPTRAVTEKAVNVIKANRSKFDPSDNPFREIAKPR